MRKGNFGENSANDCRASASATFQNKSAQARVKLSSTEPLNFFVEKRLTFIERSDTNQSERGEIGRARERESRKRGREVGESDSGCVSE
jgi:hypothetical protein